MLKQIPGTLGAICLALLIAPPAAAADDDLASVGDGGALGGFLDVVHDRSPGNSVYILLR